MPSSACSPGSASHLGSRSPAGDQQQSLRSRRSAGAREGALDKWRMVKRASLLLEVLGQQSLFIVLLGEEEAHDHSPEDDGDDARGVGPVGAVEERLLGGGDDLVGVLRVLLGGVGSALENDFVSCALRRCR